MSLSKIRIGTCGFTRYKPPEGWEERFRSRLQAYSALFDTVEINRTFYKLPIENTAERWQQEVPEEFEFSLKAWQALTHPTSSPTWRGKKSGLSESQKKNFGYLRLNEDVIKAWEETKKIAKALKARICIIQTPISFNCTEENENNMRSLLTKIKRDEIELGWEPRGDWLTHSKKVAEICSDLNLIHVVDIMRRQPLSKHPIAYIRLHGLNENEYDYNYDYSRSEIEKLSQKLISLAAEKDLVYCFFNNYTMYDNAKELKKLIF